MIVKEMKISGCRVTLRYPEKSESDSLASLQSLLETIAVNGIEDMKGGNKLGNRCEHETRLLSVPRLDE